KGGIGDPAGGGFDQTKTLAAECLAHTIDHFFIRDGVHDLVRTGGRRKIDLKVEVEHERLSDLRLMRHHAMVGVQRQSFDEDAIAHGAPSIAGITRSACTVSATSWARTIVAPFCTASRCAAIEPPRRSPGGDRV